MHKETSTTGAYSTATFYHRSKNDAFPWRGLYRNRDNRGLHPRLFQYGSLGPRCGNFIDRDTRGARGNHRVAALPAPLDHASRLMARDLPPPGVTAFAVAPPLL